MSKYPWQKFQQEIENLYVKENYTLNRLKTHLQSKDFTPSNRALKRQLKLWGYAKKSRGLRRHNSSPEYSRNHPPADDREPLNNGASLPVQTADDTLVGQDHPSLRIPLSTLDPIQTPGTYISNITKEGTSHNLNTRSDHNHDHNHVFGNPREQGEAALQVLESAITFISQWTNFVDTVNNKPQTSADTLLIQIRNKIYSQFFPNSERWQLYLHTDIQGLGYAGLHRYLHTMHLYGEQLRHELHLTECWHIAILETVLPSLAPSTSFHEAATIAYSLQIATRSKNLSERLKIFFCTRFLETFLAYGHEEDSTICFFDNAWHRPEEIGWAYKDYTLADRVYYLRMALKLIVFRARPIDLIMEEGPNVHVGKLTDALCQMMMSLIKQTQTNHQGRSQSDQADFRVNFVSRERTLYVLSKLEFIDSAFPPHLPHSDIVYAMHLQYLNWVYQNLDWENSNLEALLLPIIRRLISLGASIARVNVSKVLDRSGRSNNKEYLTTFALGMVAILRMNSYSSRCYNSDPHHTIYDLTTLNCACNGRCLKDLGMFIEFANFCFDGLHKGFFSDEPSMKWKLTMDTSEFLRWVQDLKEQIHCQVAISGSIMDVFREFEELKVRFARLQQRLAEEVGHASISPGNESYNQSTAFYLNPDPLLYALQSPEASLGNSWIGYGDYIVSAGTT